jgi:signal transduction histidine kinase
MSSPSPTRRVLLVEDDDDLRTTLAEMLENAGFEVMAAEDGQRALERLRQGPAPNAIILDLMMPGLNGWEFRLRQKLDPTLAATPVVVISADRRPEARAIDADLFFSKPFELQTLLDGLGRVLALGERRRLADRLAREDRLASIATLAAGLAHEINNPLMGVLGSLELVDRIRLRSGDDNPLLPQIGPHLETARHAALHVKKVIADVSSFARPDDHLELLDPRPVLEAALSMVSGVFPAKTRIVSEHAPVPPVRAGRGQLLQVFVNLLDNAAHALTGCDAPVVRTRTRLSDDGQALITIEDTGSGIPPDQLGRIFDPFFTTRAPGQGTGLGLSICHSFVTRFGGTIQVESELGRGSTFRIALPAAASGMRQRAGGTRDHADAAQPRIRVLIADDEPLVCSVLSQVLASVCDVTVVSSGRAALERLTEDRDFDVVLCDLNMSDVHGLEVLETIDREWPELRQRFVLMTGGVRNPMMAERVAASRARVLSKPFELSLLMSLVESIAKSSRRACAAS